MQIILVLGNHSIETMIKRLDQGISYYQKIIKEKNEDVYFMVSGKGKTEEYKFMTDYASQKISNNKIIIEDKSNSTYENLIFSFGIMKKIFNKEIIQVTICSSSFHIKRVIIMSKLLFGNNERIKLHYIHTNEEILYEEEMREANNIQKFTQFYTFPLLENKLKYQNF